MKDKLGGKIMTKIFGLRAKTYRYLIDNVNDGEKAKGTKKVCHKKKT